MSDIDATEETSEDQGEKPPNFEPREDEQRR
jgi:hypothetical protein